jgi:GNAT superfamily N-acetyltransferase
MDAPACCIQGVITMSIEIIPVRPPHLPLLADICYRAFGQLHDRHRTPKDFENPDVATAVLKMMMENDSVAGFAAQIDGRIVGSNFINFIDAVAGVGPITVDPDCQARGAGRALMQAVLDESSRRGVNQVRLLQEAINTTSLSLYTSLGFAWRDSVAIMQPGGAQLDAAIRPMSENDLDAVDALSTSQYGASRHNEVRAALAMKFPAFVRERAGKVTAYLLPGFMGHGFAPNIAEMAALVVHAATAAPPMFHRVFVPLSQSELFRELLMRRSRTIKVMSYMTVGPYIPPSGTWMPSILN